jgi:hypothetical protein
MRASSIVAAIIFIIVAVLQGIRYFNGWEVTINGMVVPLWASLCGMVVPALMAVWLLCSCCCARRKETKAPPGSGQA